MSLRHTALKAKVSFVKDLASANYLVTMCGRVSAERKVCALKGVQRNFSVVTDVQDSAKIALYRGSTSAALTSFRSAVSVDTTRGKCHALEWTMIARKLVFLPVSTLCASICVLTHVLQSHVCKNADVAAAIRSALSLVANPAMSLLARKHVISVPFSDATTPVLEYVVKYVLTGIALSARKPSSTIWLKE